MCAPCHPQMLIDNYAFFVDEMNVEGTLLYYLLQYKVLDEQEWNEIRALTTRHKRNTKLLDFILRTTSVQYGKFLASLRESEQQLFSTSCMVSCVSRLVAYILLVPGFAIACTEFVTGPIFLTRLQEPNIGPDPTHAVPDPTRTDPTPPPPGWLPK